MAKRYVIIGLGNFGYWVARELFEANQETIAIDIDADIVQKIKSYTNSPVIADATKKETLESLGVADADAVIVSLGDNTSAATLITLYLNEMGAKKILVKASNEDHAKILKKVGASEIIFPEKDMGIKIANSLVSPNILDYIDMAEGYEIAEIASPNNFIGKTLAELSLPQRFSIQVIAVKELIPENFVVVPGGDFVIKDSDILVVIGKINNIKKIRSG